MEGIELIRRLETNDGKWVRGCMVTSSADIKRVSSIVEKYAAEKVLFKYGVTEDGIEFVEFEVEAMVGHVITGFGLADIAKIRPIRINQSMDGSNLTKNLSNLTYGFKIADRAAIDSFTKKPLFLSSGTTSTLCGETRVLLLSWNLCFPLRIMMCRETKEAYKHFKHLFLKFRTFSFAKSELFKDFKDLDIKTNTDMSATWKILGVGGAAKREKYPCHCCSIYSDDLSVPNREPCTKWCRELHSDNDTWQCYHHEMLTVDHVDTLKGELENVNDEIQFIIPQMIDIAKTSKLRSDEDP